MEKVPPYNDKPKSHAEIDSKKAFSADWREALQAVYHADDLMQRRILCRLYSEGLFPKEIQERLRRLNYPTHHYVLRLPPTNVDPEDVAVLRAMDLCPALNLYLDGCKVRSS